MVVTVTPRMRVQQMIEEKRAEVLASIAERIGDDRPFVVGKSKFYPAAYLLEYDGRPVPLTVAEYKVCLLLAGRPSWTFTREQLADFIEMHEDTDERSVDTRIKRVRQAFRNATESGFNPIHTVYGVGYRWNDHPDDVQATFTSVRGNSSRH